MTPKEIAHAAFGSNDLTREDMILTLIDAYVEVEVAEEREACAKPARRWRKSLSGVALEMDRSQIETKLPKPSERGSSLLTG